MKYLKASLPLLLSQVSSVFADTDAGTYAANAENAIKTLNNKWYNANTGLW